MLGIPDNKDHRDFQDPQVLMVLLGLQEDRELRVDQDLKGRRDRLVLQVILELAEHQETQDLQEL